jgi:hypothetical protein
VSVLFTLIARVPREGTADFDAYERAVLPLLPRHGGELKQRLRHVHEDGAWTEVHVVAFADERCLDRFRADEERASHAPLLTRSRATTTLLRVEAIEAAREPATPTSS